MKIKVTLIILGCDCGVDGQSELIGHNNEVRWMPNDARPCQFITDRKCQISQDALNDHGRGMWRGQMTGHMLCFPRRRLAVRDKPKWCYLTLTGELAMIKNIRPNLDSQKLLRLQASPFTS